MKGTDIFKKTISDHLQGVADKDPLFAETLKKENKSIDECINYILGEVQKSGCNGFADDEIFGMAIHYYDEDDIKAAKTSAGRVVVNHSVELSSEEIEKAKQAALDKLVAEETAKLQKKKEPAPKKEKPQDDQVFLFE